MLFIIKDFWATVLKKKNFTVLKNFWATCACPQNRVCPEFTVLNIYIFIIQDSDSGFLSNLRLPWKQSFPWNFSIQGATAPRPPPRTPTSWNEGYITIKLDTASWCARNSLGKCYSLFNFRLVIASAWIQVCLSSSPTSTRSLNLR